MLSCAGFGDACGQKSIRLLAVSPFSLYVVSPAFDRLSRAALAPTVLFVYSWPSMPGQARRLSSGLLKPWAVVVHPKASAEFVHGGVFGGFAPSSWIPRGPGDPVPSGHSGRVQVERVPDPVVCADLGRAADAVGDHVGPVRARARVGRQHEVRRALARQAVDSAQHPAAQ